MHLTGLADPHPSAGVLRDGSYCPTGETLK